MDIWQRIIACGGSEPSDTPMPHLQRDPDLDRYHHEQHELMNKSGYTSSRIRDSYTERRLRIDLASAEVEARKRAMHHESTGT